MSWPVFTCGVCEQAHDASQIAFDCAVPIYVEGMAANEREARCELTDDCCVIDKEHFFVKGNLEIPVIGTNDHLVLNVWTTLSEQNFRRMMSLWDTAGRESEPPYFGWFSTRLPVFPDTVNLKSMVHTREVGRRPWIELEKTEHPLSLAYHEGLTLDQCQLLLSEMLHPNE